LGSCPISNEAAKINELPEDDKNDSKTFW
jgi:hypothetical protein